MVIFKEEIIPRRGLHTTKIMSSLFFRHTRASLTKIIQLAKVMESKLKLWQMSGHHIYMETFNVSIKYRYCKQTI